MKPYIPIHPRKRLGVFVAEVKTVEKKKKQTKKEGGKNRKRNRRKNRRTKRS